MPVAPSFSDLVALGIAEGQDARPDLGYQAGDVSTADVHVAAVMADHVTRFAAQCFKETFLDGAVGAALAKLVNDHINIQKLLATAAQCTLSFSRLSGGAAGSIPAGTSCATDYDNAGKRVVFTTDAAVAVGAGNNGPFTVSATASETGAATNAAAAAVKNVLDQLFDTFTVTNPSAAGGGNEVESDQDLRVRARNFWLALRRATVAAIEYGARLVPSVRAAVILEEAISGLFNLLVSDADGNSSLQMVHDVVVEIENWRAAGVLANVVGCAHLLVDLVIQVKARDGFDLAAVADQLAQAAVARIAKLRGSELMYLDPIVAAVGGLYPDDVLDVDFTSVIVGGVDKTDITNQLEYVQPAVGQVIRAGTVTVVGTT